MKNLKLIILFIAITSISCAQESPRMEANGAIDGVKIDVDYGAPSVRGRVIWGELVPYGKVWRAGANKNTTITFGKDVVINGNNLPAAKYGFFIIPNENGDWTVVFNKKNDAWGSTKYNQEEDVLRVNVSPTFVDENVEQMSFSVGETSVDFAWEKARFSIPITNK